MEKKYVAVLKAFANGTRLHIIQQLLEKPRTWTQLMFELKLNPKSLRDHLKILQDTGIVTVNKPHGYKMTEVGKELILKILGPIIEMTKGL